MQKFDLHTHTTYSDGKNTPEEMVEAAISKGLTAIGISDHSYTFFDDSYCIPKDKTDAYKAEIAVLKEKYKEKIAVFCGIEQDYYSDAPTEGFDYVIGSVHYVRIPATSRPEPLFCGYPLPFSDGFLYIPVDESAEVLSESINTFFHGDSVSFAELYFKTISDVIEKTHADIIGHFDLLTKFNERSFIIDTTDPRYIHAWQASVDKLLKTDACFEINTGAISRGYRTTPYPASDIQEYIIDRFKSSDIVDRCMSSNSRKISKKITAADPSENIFIWSSDSHSSQNIASYFI